jgi:hypothetical protein
MRIKLYFAAAALMVLCITVPISATAQAPQWSSPVQYDQGEDTYVAVHPSGMVLEFHQSHAPGNRYFWYHVGVLDGTSVTWGPSQPASHPANISGTWPNVVITKEGYVILVYSTGQFKSGSDLRYRVGQINLNGDVTQSITWLTNTAHWDAGFHSSTAINDNGVIVSVHETGHSSDGLYFRVGHLTNPAGGDYSVTWDSGNSGIQYDAGVDPHIAINDNNDVVEVHGVAGESLLHYHRGVVNGGTIKFERSLRYENHAARPSVALLDSGLVLEIDGRSDGIYVSPGTLSSNPELIDFENAYRISGTGTYPAIATNGNYAVATWTYYFDLTGRLFYAVAEIP